VTKDAEPVKSPFWPPTWLLVGDITNSKDRVLVALNDANGDVAVAFRGTVKTAAMLNNLDATKTKFRSFCDQRTLFTSYTSFAASYREIISSDAESMTGDALLTQLRRLITHGKRTPRRLFITGHSRGGALASLLTLHLSLDAKGASTCRDMAAFRAVKEIITYTWGEPRMLVGDDAFVTASPALANVTKFRVINQFDLVPALRISLTFSSGKHWGTPVWWHSKHSQTTKKTSLLEEYRSRILSIINGLLPDDAECVDANFPSSDVEMKLENHFLNRYICSAAHLWSPETAQHFPKMICAYALAKKNLSPCSGEQPRNCAYAVPGKPGCASLDDEGFSLGFTATAHPAKYEMTFFDVPGCVGVAEHLGSVVLDSCNMWRDLRVKGGRKERIKTVAASMIYAGCHK
jgi:hypothetical protein